MLVFFLFCGKWLFCFEACFSPFWVCILRLFPMFLSFVPLLGNFFPCVGTFVPAFGTFPARVFAHMIRMCRALLVPLVLPFCFFSLVLGVRIRLIPLFLSWNAKILRFPVKKSCKSLAVAHKVATFASAFGREPFAIVLWEFYMRQER